MLLIAVGIVYVKAYMNMAKRNSKENEPYLKSLEVFGLSWLLLWSVWVYT